MRRLTLIAFAIFLTTTAFAQMPPGKWWRRLEVAQQLQLTEEQQSKLDAIARIAAPDLIDLKADMDKLNIALRNELDQQQLNRAAIKQLAQKLSDARSRRFERELMMFVDMRAVLNDAQWTRMRSFLDRMNAEGQEQRPMRRNNPMRGQK